ncbi:MAG: SixA phosphatase family protein [Acidimicrobiales bacterium]
MAIYLVRHAKAGDRDKWSAPDHLRPLSKKGHAQATGLVGQLGDRGITRILSSPFVRCVQTVEPLANHLDLKVEEDDVLAEAAAPQDVAALARELVTEGEQAVLCSHGDVIPLLLDHLMRVDGLRLEPEFACAKGSTWILDADEDESTRFVRGMYLFPPPSP